MPNTDSNAQSGVCRRATSPVSWDVQLFGNEDQHRDEFEEVVCELLLSCSKI